MGNKFSVFISDTIKYELQIENNKKIVDKQNKIFKENWRWNSKNSTDLMI